MRAPAVIAVLSVGLIGCGSSGMSTLQVAPAPAIARGIAAFQTCVSRSSLLALSRERAANALQVIKDQAHGGAVAEFGFLPSVHAARVLFNSAQFRSSPFKYQSGRFLLLATSAAPDPDITAVQNCSQRAFRAR